MDDRANQFIPTRQSLLLRLKDWDDQDSWRDFYDTYWRLIFRFAIKAGLDESEAQDALQETVITVARSIKEFNYDRRVGTFKSWLLNITHWRIVDQKRKRKQGNLAGHAATDCPGGTPLVESVPDPAGGDLQAIWDDEWTQNLIFAAAESVKRLVKAKHYQAYDFLVVKQMPVKEVSRRLGLHPSRVYYARYKVGALMKKELRRLQRREL